MAGRSRATVVVSFEDPEVDTVSCHAFSADEKSLALCPNNEEVHIYQPVGGEFQRTHLVTKHSQRVTGLSWSIDGRLVSVSEDRTACVWEWNQSAAQWRFVLVELRAPRAALSVSWAPNGKRFAVGLASRDVAVCHYEADMQVWVAKKIARSKAAVVAVAWHPSSAFLATGSTDHHCRVFDVNEAGDPPFGEAFVDEDAAAWVNSVAFSPTGRYLAFVPQDSSARFKDLTGGPEAPVQVVRWRRLPFLLATFVGSDDCLVACGFDCAPVLFHKASSGWEVRGVIDAAPGPGLGDSIVSTASGVDVSRRDSYQDARQRFRRAATVEELGTSWHSNTIVTCFAHTCAAAADRARFSTSGLDGRIVVWELPTAAVEGS